MPELPLLPGFREMALRRMSAERRRLVADLTAQRRAAGLSQTEIAARMGTSQSAVARLETGDADVRVSTLERYAAAIGSQLAWQAQTRQDDGPGLAGPGPVAAGRAGPVTASPAGPGPVTAAPPGPDPIRPGFVQPGDPQAGQPQAGQPQAGQPRGGQPRAEPGQEYRR